MWEGLGGLGFWDGSCMVSLYGLSIRGMDCMAGSCMGYE